jgi:hypothetical protein
MITRLVKGFLSDAVKNESMSPFDSVVVGS